MAYRKSHSAKRRLLIAYRIELISMIQLAICHLRYAISDMGEAVKRSCGDAVKQSKWLIANRIAQSADCLLHIA